jgi:hypothetical protein
MPVCFHIFPASSTTPWFTAAFSSAHKMAWAWTRYSLLKWIFVRLLHGYSAVRNSGLREAQRTGSDMQLSHHVCYGASWQQREYICSYIHNACMPSHTHRTTVSVMKPPVVCFHFSAMLFVPCCGTGRGTNTHASTQTNTFLSYSSRTLGDHFSFSLIIHASTSKHGWCTSLFLSLSLSLLLSLSHSLPLSLSVSLSPPPSLIPFNNCAHTTTHTHICRRFRAQYDISSTTFCLLNQL